VKILLDECVPWPLSRQLKSHQCTNPHRLGWAGLRNGDLLAEAETKFEVFITSDQSLRYQQNRKGRGLAILELWTNDWRSIQPDMNEIIPIIDNLQPEDFIFFTPYA
jgi:hypothetical protein